MNAKYTIATTKRLIINNGINIVKEIDGKSSRLFSCAIVYSIYWIGKTGEREMLIHFTSAYRLYVQGKTINLNKIMEKPLNYSWSFLVLYY